MCLGGEDKVIRETAVDYRLTIKELPVSSRPRERLVDLGPEGLYDAELLAIILVSGTRQETALDLANRLLSEFGGLKGLLDVSVEELVAVSGIGIAKACQVKAALELAKRVMTWREDALPVIKSPADVAALVLEQMRHLDREHFRALCLDTKNRVIAVENISVGSLNASIVHPREVFKSAIRRSAAALILVHNHPSGDTRPSTEDVEVTRRLQEAGKLLGISVLDHIIIGDGKYLSMRERELLLFT